MTTTPTPQLSQFPPLEEGTDVYDRAGSTLGRALVYLTWGDRRRAAHYGEPHPDNTTPEQQDLMARSLKWAVDHESTDPTGAPRFDMGRWFDWVADSPVKQIYMGLHDETAVLVTEDDPVLTCGTACCLAGTAVALSAKPGDALGSDRVFLAGGVVTDYPTEGAQRLGLTTAQADLLFAMTNHTIEEITLVASWFHGRDYTAVLG